MLEVEVVPGPHNVIAHIDWCSSNSFYCVVPESGRVELEVASNLRGPRLLLAPWYVFFRRRAWVRIRSARTMP